MTVQERTTIKTRIRRAINESPNRYLFRKVSLFGSYAYGTPRANSDVDLLIELEPNAPVGLFKLVQLQRELGLVIGKHVDLVTQEGLSKYIKDDVLKSAQLVYEKR